MNSFVRGYRLGKRVFDALAAGVLLLCVSPLLLLTALLVRLRIGSPVLWRERRPGLHGVPFTLVKFRTMTDARDERGNLLADAARLTPLGRLLRNTSLDELPELVNVLAGDLSLVGPRPLRMDYLERYTPEQMHRHDVPPGVTGWAQVNGRNALTWEEKFDLDLWYVDHCSFLLDVKILAMTAWKILTREGINAKGHATAPEFLGTRRSQP